MSRVQKLQMFVSQRLHAAVEDIVSAFVKAVMTYEQEAALCQEVISRQHALLCALHSPLMELPPADVFTQQLLASKEVVPPTLHDPEPAPAPPPIKEEQDREQLQHLDEADIIEFTYKSCAGRPREHLQLAAEPGPTGPHQDIQLVMSSETEDSEDYNKDSAAPPATPNKPQAPRRPGGGFSCQACSRTFKARRFLFKHVKAHLQEAQPLCGLCSERFDGADSLKLHLQTHLRKRELQNQMRTRSRKRRLQQRPCSGGAERQPV